MQKDNKKGKNLEDIQQMNRSLVINLLRRKEVCSRVDLAKATGLKQATITKIINDLIDYGLVIETGNIVGEKGRRSIQLSINGQIYRVICLRLARRYFTVGVFDIVGNVFEMEKVKIDILSSPRIVMDRIMDVITKMMGSLKDNKVLGIGVAIPGPFIRSEGKIGLMSEFPGWEEISIEEELTSKFGLPAFVDHDANVGALAEWWLGTNSFNAGTMVYIAAGQGIGAGIIHDGKAFTGAFGIAGEIGHTSICFDGPKCECGNRGCLEMYCSTIALLKEIRKELEYSRNSLLTKDCTLNDVFKAIKEGDALAVKAFEKVAAYLGQGVVNIIYTYNPNVIIIGDELSQAGQRLLDIVCAMVKEYVLPRIYKDLTIQLSSFTMDPVLLGAGSLVIDNLKNILPPD